MDFALNDEQLLIQQSARNLFAGECPVALLHAAWEAPEAAAPLWQNHLRDWAGLAEQPLADAALFMEEHGRAAAPGVFLPTLLAHWAAAAAEVELAGSATVAVSGPAGDWEPNASARKFYVPCARQVEEILVVGGAPDRPTVAILPADAVTCVDVDNLDRLRPVCTVDAGGAREGRPVSPAHWESVVHRALVACAAELVGVGRRALDMALDYARERRQFDRPIGSFQGLQWKLVDAAMELERAAASVAYAAMCVDAGDGGASRAAHCAKLEAGVAARHCARTSLQVHGGIGYTFEHGLHYWLRRAYAGDAFMGPADYHARRIAQSLFAA